MSKYNNFFNKSGKKNAKHVGNFFEMFIDKQLKDYLYIGIADINKENDARYFKSKLRVDFTGWTRVFDSQICFNKAKQKMAQPIGFDCKTVTTKKFDYRYLKDHQLIYLKRLAYVGGIAFLLIEFSSFNKIFRLDIKRNHIDNPPKDCFLYHYYNNGKKSININDIETKISDDNKKVFTANVLPCDFLGVGDIDFKDLRDKSLLLF